MLKITGFISPEALFDLSRAVALAIAETVEAWTGGAVRCDLKWPNDLYADGQKVGGLLIENRWNGAGPEWSVVGLGLNVNQTAFPTGLAATSLKALTGQTWSLEEGATRVQAAVAGSLARLVDPAALRTRYQARLLGAGQKTRFVEPGGEAYTGILIGTTAEGLLRVLSHTGERRYEVKEVVQEVATRG